MLPRHTSGRVRLGLVTLSVLATSAMTACDGGSGAATATGAPADRAIAVSARNSTYAPATIEVAAGKTVSIRISDIITSHTFTISPWNVNIAVTKMGSQDISFTVPANATGEVEYFCSVHAGMGGKVRVKAS